MNTRVTVTAVAVLALLASSAPAAMAESDSEAHDPVVVADGLDNPRQLNWSPDNRTLLIAEAGRGGDDCSTESPELGPQCVGMTGAISTVHKPWRDDHGATRVITGLSSAAGPGGAFALGHTGVDGLASEGEFVSAQNSIGDPATDVAQGLYLLVDGADDMDTSVLGAALFEAESELNPGGGQIESNPYAVLYVDRGHALVADAAANAVWKVTPDHDAELPDECSSGSDDPEFDHSACVAVDVTVFASWPDRPAPPEGATDEELEEFWANAPTEFVPTSLDIDRRGRIYVGGLGSEVPGAASVVKFDRDGTHLRQWDGFTSITGVAVALGEAETRPDQRTLLALGADPAVRRRITAARAGVLATIAGVLAVPAGLLPVWGLLFTAEAPIVLPLPEVLGTLAMLPLTAILGAALLSRPIPPWSAYRK